MKKIETYKHLVLPQIGPVAKNLMARTDATSDINPERLEDLMACLVFIPGFTSNS